MKFILYLTKDHEPCVGEVAAGKTVEQVCQEVKGTWIDFGERRHYRTREEGRGCFARMKSFMPTAAFWALVNSTASDDGPSLLSRSQPMTSIAPKAERYFAVSSETFLISF